MSSILHGLNIVHPPHNLPSNFQNIPSDIDIWATLDAFASDDPAPPKKQADADEPDDDDQDDHNHDRAAALPDSHINVVTPTHVLAAQPPPQPPFDTTLHSFLASIGIDPFAVQAPFPSPTQDHPHPQLHQQSVITRPSIAQLLAFHSSAAPGAFHIPTQQSPSAPSTPSDPPAKRSRKASLSSSDYRDPSSTPAPPSPSVSLSPAEDKRRRNTAASARFRMKKKEREAALESKARELEGKVGELERECEGLRRENGWLKGLVVGVTGAAAQPQPHPAPLAGQTQSVGVGVGGKRGREEDH